MRSSPSSEALGPHSRVVRWICAGRGFRYLSAVYPLVSCAYPPCPRDAHNGAVPLARTLRARARRTRVSAGAACASARTARSRAADCAPPHGAAGVCHGVCARQCGIRHCADEADWRDVEGVCAITSLVTGIRRHGSQTLALLTERVPPYAHHPSAPYQVISRVYQSDDAALQALRQNSQILLPVYSSPELVKVRNPVQQAL